MFAANKVFQYTLPNNIQVALPVSAKGNTEISVIEIRQTPKMQGQEYVVSVLVKKDKQLNDIGCYRFNQFGTPVWHQEKHNISGYQMARKQLWEMLHSSRVDAAAAKVGFDIQYERDIDRQQGQYSGKIQLIDTELNILIQRVGLRVWVAHTLDNHENIRQLREGDTVEIRYQHGRWNAVNAEADWRIAA